MPVKKTGFSDGKLTKTGESDNFAGYDCDYYDVLNGDTKFRDICVTGWDDFPEGQEVAGAMQEMGDFFASMRDAFAKSGGLDLMDSQQEMFAYMKELDGYPTRAREFDAAGEVTKETVLIDASNGEVDLALFDPPSKYQGKDLQ